MKRICHTNCCRENLFRNISLFLLHHKVLSWLENGFRNIKSSETAAVWLKSNRLNAVAAPKHLQKHVPRHQMLLQHLAH